MDHILYFFNPRTVAVIGASSKPGKIGHECFKNMLKGKFRGNVYPINPSVPEVLGVKAYPSIEDVPENIDLVIYALPAKDSVEIFNQFKKKSVKAVIVISGGFREFSENGIMLEEEILKIAERDGFRIIGPNCVGVYDSFSGVDSLFQPYERLPRPKMGNIAVVSQSGTFAVTFMDWASEENIGISKVVSVGNRADVDEAELIEFLDKDPNTKVIALYLESFTDGRRLVNAIKNCTKPVIVLLASKSSYGAMVAKSHTGRVASNYLIAKDVIEYAGAVIADDLQQLYDITKSVSLSNGFMGKNIIMITNGAGPCVIAADLIQEYELNLIEPSNMLKSKLKEHLPSYAIINNPIDLTGSATSKDFLNAIKVCDDSDEVDIILLFIVFQDVPLEDDFVKHLTENKSKKPIFIFAAGGQYTREKFKILHEANLPSFQNIKNLVKSVSNIIDFSKKSKLKYL
ncbi:MAG: CoA-binding protein [Nitrososphaeria archaeon]|nr:CoA-binding protein [Nitrososphaeria archaeon]